ncbi:hypothetical protein [Serratia liquefaciens]|uniref:hypothetical protein n=1 Tax=Serratia liquefaciens TaxID=614 RepID=UPI000DFFA3A6|nr:hypothetical protein [Serratia liquefaciens]SUI89603.1 Uncharacterised protein [Serratia liquefaciens]
MLTREIIEKVIISIAHQQGTELCAKDPLDLRTGVAATLAAKERHRQRMTTPTYQWKKPELRR